MSFAPDGTAAIGSKVTPGKCIADTQQGAETETHTKKYLFGIVLVHVVNLGYFLHFYGTVDGIERLAESKLQSISMIT
ncbi:MAG: hypothetical protein EHM30_15130 [Desulfobacteraceae bacterium]|nr:MAG: hypothetical protein EHM30_15130 [Desulfobacteraceae bacterium]